MMSKVAKILVCVLVGLGLFMPSANKPADAKSRKKVGFFTRVKRAIKRKVKRTIKKTRRAIVRSGCAVQNKIMDGAVNAKRAITGKRPKQVWVKGHYKKGNKHHTSGHFRYNRKRSKPSAGPGPAPAPAPTGADSAMPQ